MVSWLTGTALKQLPHCSRSGTGSARAKTLVSWKARLASLWTACCLCF